MTDYRKIQQLDISTFQKVPEGLFGDAMAAVIREAGPMSDEEAMRIVEAVFGPLLLLPPPPLSFLLCGHAYAPVEGGWVFCAKDHSGDGDPEFHHSADGEVEWDSDERDERAFDPWQ